MTSQRLPKGSLSQKSNPTLNAVIMFFIYLTSLPKDWDIMVINDEAVQKVREYFGVTYGFDRMIYWGINVSCAKSKTSKGRYVAMSKAYHDAKGLIGKGYQIPTKIEPIW